MNRRSDSKAPASTLRERMRETTSEVILQAAEEVFADDGLHAAHMGTIAAKAGVSVGTLYNHFEDREALLVGLLAARRIELLEKLDAAIAETSTLPLRGRLRGILGAFCAHCERHRKYLHVVLQREVGGSQQTFPQAWAQKHDTMREIHRRIDDEMKRGVDERALRSELGDLAGTFFLGMLRGLMMRDILFEEGAGMAVEMERMLDAFFDGVGTQGAAA